jgi:hypothetical protein
MVFLFHCKGKGTAMPMQPGCELIDDFLKIAKGRTALNLGFPHCPGMDIQKDDVVPGIDEQLIIDFSGAGFVVVPTRTLANQSAGRFAGFVLNHPDVPGFFVELEPHGGVIGHRDDLKSRTVKAGRGTDSGRTGGGGVVSRVTDLAFGQIILRSGLNGDEGRGQRQACDNKRKYTLFHKRFFFMKKAQIMYRRAL